MGRRTLCRKQSHRWHDLGIVVVLPLALLPLHQREAEGQPAIEVIEAGWDGLAVWNEWTPVRLRVTGSVPHGRVLVEVIADAEHQSAPQAAPMRYATGAYGQEIDLAPGSSREVTVWYLANRVPYARARLSAGGETLAERELPFRMVRGGWPLIAVLAEAPALTRALRSVEIPVQGLPIGLPVAELRPAAIPSKSGLFDGIGALVVQGSAAADLTESQREAMLAWVRSGGHLALVGGPGAVHAARILPDGALPLTYLEVDGAAPTGALGDWVESLGDAPSPAPRIRFHTDGGAVLAGTREAPLASRLAIGRGTVTVLGLDPALEPLASWPGVAGLLRAALDPALPVAEDGQQRGWSGPMPATSQRMQGLVSMVPRDAYPDWRLAATVLCLFAIAVGPVLYLLLRQVGWRELSWVAVPVAATALLSGLYLWGVHRRGTDLIASVASYIEVDAESKLDGQAPRQSIMAAFYAPTRRELSVPLRGEGAVWAQTDQSEPPARQMTGEGNGAMDPPFRIIDGVDRRVSFTTGQYAARQLRLETELVSAPRVDAEITVEDGLIVGTVRNETGLRLEDAAVLVGTSLARLGNLAPGQSVPVRLEPPTFVHPRAGYESPAYLLFGEPAPAPAGTHLKGPAGSMVRRRLPNDPEIQRRARFLELLSQLDPRPRASTMPLTFVAYTRTSTSDAVLPLPDGAVHHLTLLRQELDLALAPGPFTMPAGLIPPHELDQSTADGSRVHWDDQAHRVDLWSGSITFAFRPPLPVDARAQTLILTTEQIDAPGPDQRARQVPGDSIIPAEEGIFSIYDWENAAWTRLPERSEHKLDAHRYAGPDGEVRVRLSAPENTVRQASEARRAAASNSFDPVQLNRPSTRVVLPSLAIEGRAGDMR